MMQYLRLISFVLLAACGVNIAEASHIITKDACAEQTIETASIVGSGADSQHVSYAFEHDSGKTSKDAPVSNDGCHQCHLGHCSFTIAVFSSLCAPVITASANLEIAHRPESVSFCSLDRPPRA